MLALRLGRRLRRRGGKRCPMGGFVPVKGFVEQLEEAFLGGHRSQWEVEMWAGHPFEQMAVLGLGAGQHANDDVDDLRHELNPAQCVKSPVRHEAR